MEINKSNLLFQRNGCFIRNPAKAPMLADAIALISRFVFRAILTPITTLSDFLMRSTEKARTKGREIQSKTLQIHH